jgi:hypothetical protein
MQTGSPGSREKTMAIRAAAAATVAEAVVAAAADVVADAAVAADVVAAAAVKLKTKTMNTTKNKISQSGTKFLYLTGTLSCLLLPLLFIYLQYYKANPFRLKGKEFLAFYILLLLICHLTRRLERTFIREHIRERLWGRLLVVLILATGIARLIQGIYNAQPVGYLVLLLLLHLLLTALYKRDTNQRLKFPS